PVVTGIQFVLVEFKRCLPVRHGWVCRLARDHTQVRLNSRHKSRPASRLLPACIAKRWANRHRDSAASAKLLLRLRLEFLNSCQRGVTAEINRYVTRNLTNDCSHVVKRRRVLFDFLAAVTSLHSLSNELLL